MDFVSDQLYDGRKLRALTLIDAYTRECLAIWIDQGIRGEHVVNVLETVSAERGAPRRIQVENGPEFVSKVLDRWAYERHVELSFSRPGKPTDNAFIKAFNGRLRQECLNQHWFLSLDDARITRVGPTVHWDGQRRPNSPVVACKRTRRRVRWTRKTPPRSSSKTGAGSTVIVVHKPVGRFLEDADANSLDEFLTRGLVGSRTTVTKDGSSPDHETVVALNTLTMIDHAEGICPGIKGSY
jgi:transposase InsO family protein